jgi:DNA polymerase III delta prime subunit
MPASGRTVWYTWGSKLSKTQGDEFIKEITPLLKLFHAELDCHDVPGTDLVVWSDNEPFPYAIQCQGFDDLILGNKQAEAVRKSVEQFISTGYRCKNYYVIHNSQSGAGGQKFQEFDDSVKSCLKSLYERGISEELPELMDRKDFIKEASKKLEGLLRSRLNTYSKKLKDEIQERFKFSSYYIPGVPLSEIEVGFRNFDFPVMGKVKSFLGNYSITESILSDSKKIRWTLLHGEPGSGKTTTALQASALKGKTVLFVPCELFSFHDLQSGTNVLLEQIVRSLNILGDEFSDRDKEIILGFSGATLSNILENSDAHALIFDGLDENRFYSDPKAGGLKLLSDRLENFDCPIILTTRTSHFKASYEELSQALSGSAQATHHRKFARLLELTKWQMEQVVELIGIILSENNEFLDSEKSRISEFKNILLSGEYESLYGQLPFNPLFLQFILEDIVDIGIQKSNRISLIFNWIRRKIRRDLVITTRSFPVEKEYENFDYQVAIDAMLWLMEYVSERMVVETNEGYDLKDYYDLKEYDYYKLKYELKEYVEFSEIQEEAKNIFKVNSVALIDILLNSVLTSQANLSGSEYRSSKDRLTFIFKIFQEYFLACILVRKKRKPFGFPDSVKSFYQEIQETTLSAPDSDFTKYIKDFSPSSIRFSDIIEKQELPSDELLDFPEGQFILSKLLETIQKLSLQPSTMNNIKEVVMGDKGDNYYVGQAGAVGKDARSDNNTFIQNIDQNFDEITALINSLRDIARRSFPIDRRDEVLVHLDDLQEDIAKPEKKKPERIKIRLLALAAAVGTIASGVAGMADFSNNVFELSEKLGVKIEFPSIGSSQ